MELSFLLKVAGVGFLTAVAYQILARTGREEQAMAVSVAGIVVALLMLLTQIGTLFANLRSVFGF